MAKITLGPIIGKVTDTTARILIETDGDAAVQCIATADNEPELKFDGNPRKNRAFVFALEGLKPGTRYNFTFSGVTGNFAASSVRTYDTNIDQMQIAAVSCNFPSRNGDNDMWGKLRDSWVATGELDLILHVGDQVYGDSVFDKAMSILRLNDPKGKKAQDEAIMELYRGLYRKNWTVPAIRDVLANVSNLMIWDDHEIRDDWGSRKKDYDPTSNAFRIGTLGRLVYREYQRQLWDENYTGAAPATSTEHHFHVWNKIGVLFLDQRGARSFGRETARPYLGTPQWNEITYQLTNGELSNVRALIVVTSVPLLYLSSSITDIGDSVVNDLLDHWSHPDHSKEQIEMVRALREWKSRESGQRELLVVGGDVHIGTNTDVKYQNQSIFKQLITSPITNHPPPSYLFFGLKTIARNEIRLSNNYSYKHEYLINKRNYGIIDVRIPTDGVPKVEGTLQKET